MSAEQIFDGLAPVLARWTLGGSATGEAPAQWRPVLDGCHSDEAELRLLALTGQFLDVLVTQDPPRNLRLLSDVPMLALPVMPEELRPLTRRCLKALKEANMLQDLMRFLAARNVCVHPADWMPSTSDERLPDIYAPWRDWASKALGSGILEPDADLTEQNWSDYGPAARCAALKALRQRDPAQARALLVAKANTESAEIRLGLVRCLSVGLCADDIPYLQSLSGDRASSVKRLATSMLTRLGQHESDGSEAVELADFFEIQTVGLLRRTRTLQPRAIKTPAQKARRGQLFETTDFGAFVSALALDAEDFFKLWPFGKDADADARLIAMAGQSASDAAITQLCMRLEAGVTIDMPTILVIRERLDPMQRKHLAYRFLESEEAGFGWAFMIARAGSEMDISIDGIAGRKLIASLASGADSALELERLGLLSSHRSAISLLADLTKAGLAATDPRLDVLRLNAALADTGSKT